MSSEKIIKTFDDLNTIYEHIFVTKPGAVSCYSLWGNGTSAKGDYAQLLVDAWKSAWMAKKKEENIYCIELDMGEFKVNTNVELTMWKIWFEIVGQLSKNILVDELVGSEFKKKKIRSLYQYFTEEMKPEDVGEDNDVTAQINFERLFKCYTELGVHVILVMKNFEKCKELFPQDKDTSFFRTLFVMSPKGSSEPINLTILLCCLSQIKDIAHHYDGISPVPSAYPDGTAGGGNLAQYSEEDFEAYLKSLTE